MTSARAIEPDLIAGALSLDFANTCGGRKLEQPIDRLQEAADLVAWAEHAGVLDPATGKRLRAELARDEPTARRWLRRALTLREAIHGIGASIERGEAPAAVDLATVLAAARQGLAGASLARTADGVYRPDFAGNAGSDAILGPIAWDAIEVLGHGPLDRLKACPAEDCGWLFIDRSKSGTRRWCDMATCGNRAKAARHRAKSKAASSGETTDPAAPAEPKLDVPPIQLLS